MGVVISKWWVWSLVSDGGVSSNITAYGTGIIHCCIRIS